MKNKISLFQETKSILNENGIRLNRNLGQNYLIDNNKRLEILKYAELNEDDVVLEIGPGIGTLTLEIAKKVKKVIAIEKDKKIYEILKNRLEKESIDNVELINDDALKLEFQYFNKIVSNLPYQISSPISFKFLEYSFDLAILMYQKEFAVRMNAEVGEKQYSRLRAMLYFYADTEILTSIGPESFIPKPKVDSLLVKLVPKENNQVKDKNSYESLCRCLFQHKNKKIRNALIDSYHEIGLKDKKEVKNLIKSLEEYPIDLNKRVIKTSPEEILELSKKVKNYVKQI